MVLLAPFLFHTQSEPLVAAAKGANVPWALVDGYGVAAVKLGLERFLGGRRGEVTLHVEDSDEAGTRAR